MTVVWKQGLYSYKDPFSLSAQARDHQGETLKESFKYLSVDVEMLS